MTSPERLEHERTAEIYGRYARDRARRRRWSPANPGNQAIQADLRAAIGEVLPASGAVLDVGCGTGWLLETLAHHNPALALYGVDLLADRVDAAHRRVPSARVTQGSALALPAATASVDAVTFITVLSSLRGRSDRRAALAEARRVVRPGGVVVVWEPRVPTPNRRTCHVPVREVREALAPCSLARRSITLLPPLARRLPSARAYAVLSQVSALRTHRLIVARLLEHPSEW